MKLADVLLILLFANSSTAQLRLEYKIGYSGMPGQVEVIRFAPDGQHFYSGDNRGYIFEWDLGQEKPVREFKSLFGKISSLQFSPDGSILASSAPDGSIYLWSLKTGESLRRIRAPRNPEIALAEQFFTAISPDNLCVYFGGRNRYICKAPINNKERAEIVYKSDEWDIKAGMFNTDGELVFAAGNKIHFMKDDKVIREIDCVDCQTNALHYDKSGKYILTWCEDGTTRAWNAATGKQLYISKPGEGGPKISNLDFSMTEKYTVTGFGNFNVWDVNHTGFLFGTGDQVINFEFEDENQRWLASSGNGKDIQLWRIYDPKQETEEPVLPENFDLSFLDEPLEEEKEEEPKKEEVKPKAEIQPAVAKETRQIEVEELAVAKINKANQEAEKVKAPKVMEAKPVVADEKRPENKTQPKAEAETKSYKLPEKINGRRVLPIKAENKLAFAAPNLNITVWDNKIMDGDVISLYINDSLVLENYSLDTIPMEIPVYVAQGEKTYLTLHAHNLGTVPPNTADIKISDGTKEYQIELKSDFQGSSVAEIFVE